MANVDLSGEQITVIPAEALGCAVTVHHTVYQTISMIELFFDFLGAGDAYLGSSHVMISDSTQGITPEAWDAAKLLVKNPAKTPEDLMNILVGTEWGKDLLAAKWKTRSFIQIDGK